MVFMRRRPLLRAAAVGGGAYLAGKHAASRRADQYQNAVPDQRTGDPERRQPAEAPRAAGPQAAPPTMADQLDQLASLHNQGVLDDDEFAAAKAKLLGT